MNDYIDPVLADEARELMEDCRNNTMLFCKMIMPGRFNFPFSENHRKVFAALDDDSIKRLLLVAHRGFGKTSIVRGFCMKRIYFNQSRYIVPVSSSEQNALNQTETLKNELLGNEMFVKLRGNLKGEWFSKEQWVTSNGVAVMPRGAGQPIRGLLWNGYRPDLIIYDDVEKTEGVMSDDQRKKLKKHFYDDTLQAVDLKVSEDGKPAANWRVIVIGNLLHEDSLIANIVNQHDEEVAAGKVPQWHVIEVPLCSDDGKLESKWPEAFPDNVIRGIKEQFDSAGEPDSFYAEYLNVSVSSEANFTKVMMQRYNEVDLPLSVLKRLESVVLIDPAKTTKDTSCNTAIVTWGVDFLARRYFLRDVDVGKYKPAELYERAFTAMAVWKARVLGVEVTSLEEFITYPLKALMISKGLNYDIVELRSRVDKEARVRAGLLPMYERKQVWHNERIAEIMELSLRTFPKCKKGHWDVIDAASYLPQILDEGSRFFLGGDGGDYADEDKALANMRADDYAGRRLERVSLV